MQIFDFEKISDLRYSGCEKVIFTNRCVSTVSQLRNIAENSNLIFSYVKQDATVRSTERTTLLKTAPTIFFALISVTMVADL